MRGRRDWLVSHMLSLADWLESSYTFTCGPAVDFTCFYLWIGYRPHMLSLPDWPSTSLLPLHLNLADFLTTFLLVATSILAVIVGFTSQDIYKTLYIGLGGTALTFLLVVPQWPFYNRKPENWLPARVQKASSSARNVDLGGVQIEVDGKRVG